MAGTILEQFDRDPRWADSNYFDGETLPVNTSVTSTVVNSGAGSKMGQDKIITRAATDIVMTVASDILVTYEDSENGVDGWGTLGTITFTADSTTPFAAKDLVVPEFTIPNQARAFTRATIATDDLAITGSIDMYNSRQANKRL